MPNTIPEYARLALRGLIFDFDGTLAVSTLDFGLMRRRAKETMAAFVPVPDLPDLPTMELLAAVCSPLEAKKAQELRDAVLATVKQVEIDAARHSSLFAFVRPMLASCRNKNIHTAIVTRNCPEAVTAIFPDVLEHCPCLLTREHVPQVKPHPGHLLRALKILNIPPAQALMIGDHPMDIIVGQRAGTLTAAVATGEKSAEELQEHTPDYYASDGHSLMRLLGIL